MQLKISEVIVCWEKADLEEYTKVGFMISPHQRAAVNHLLQLKNGILKVFKELSSAR